MKIFAYSLWWGRWIMIVWWSSVKWNTFLGVCFRCLPDAFLGRCSRHCPQDGDPGKNPRPCKRDYVSLLAREIAQALFTRGYLSAVLSLDHFRWLLTMRTSRSTLFLRGVPSHPVVESTISRSSWLEVRVGTKIKRKTESFDRITEENAPISLFSLGFIQVLHVSSRLYPKVASLSCSGFVSFHWFMSW